jgi:hypothetical protein
MSKNKYELWLDESGNFINESEKTGSPSVVGGILVPARDSNEKWSTDLVNLVRSDYHITERYIHGTELRGSKYGEMAVNLLKQCIENDARLVIFENEERVDIVNSDMTYLNIMAEGIIQLLQALAAEHDEIELAILAANRVKVAGMEERKETILLKDIEYKERLAEKIALGLARRNLIRSRQWKWFFKLDSAKANPRLMIADVVCHSWYVQNGKKFTDEAREELRQLYQPSFLFSVFEHATEAAIRRSIAEGSIGDALFEWLDAKTTKVNINHQELAATLEMGLDYDYYLKLITSKLSSMPETAQATQLSIVENQIESLISIDRDFEKSTLMLEQLKADVLPAMEGIGIKNRRFFFKVYESLLKIANHRGNVILAAAQIDSIKSILDQLTGRWETIDDVLGYMILEGVHQMNTYDFQGTINGMNKVQNFIDTSFEILSISLIEDLSLLSEDMKSDLKGKVLGTRLQARSFLIRQDGNQLELARIDSDNAMKQFSGKSDLNRQYQYRSQIECEAKQPVAALVWLAKAFQVTYQSPNDLKMLLAAIKDSRYIDQIFGSMHFTRALAAAYQSNHFDLAEKMFQEWVKSGIEQNLFGEEIVSEHPYEIILWKQAFYMGKTDRVKAAIEKYDQAIQICHASEDRFTLRSIGLVILFEKASVLLESGKKYSQDAKKALQAARKYYDLFMSEKLPTEMRSYFEPMDTELNKLVNLSGEEQSKVLFSLSQKIPY